MNPLEQGELVFQTYLDFVSQGETPDAEEFLAQAEPACRPHLRTLIERYQAVSTHLAIGSAALRPGAVIDDYRLGCEIGRGGMGVVWEAEQISVARKVAFKVLYPIYYLSSTSRRRFKNEASAAAKINHDGVVRVFAFGEKDGNAYIVSELIAGAITMADWLQSGSHPDLNDKAWFQSVGKLFKAIAEGLAAAHQVGVVHRDIKPANILIDKNGLPKIADFGLAKFEGASVFTQAGAQTGTPSYMSPEQARGDSELGTASDLFSLGVCLYEALCGENPFLGENRAVIIRSILHTRIPDVRTVNPNVPRDLAIICSRLLEFDPRDRVKSATGLAVELEHWLSGRAISLYPAGKLELVYRWCRLHPARALLLTSLLIAFVGVSSLWMKNLRILSQAEDALRAATELTGLLDPDESEMDFAEARAQLVIVEKNVYGLFSGRKFDLSRQLFLIGRSYRYLEQWTNAVRVLTASLDAVPSGEQFDNLRNDIKLNLAWALPRAQIDLDSRLSKIAGEDREQLALELLIEVFHSNNPYIQEQGYRWFAALNRIGTIALNRKQFGAAKWCFKRVHEGLAERGQHFSRIGLLNQLDTAILMYQIGDYEVSESMARNVIGRYRVAMGATHPETAYAMLVLGTSLAQSGELEMAKAKIIRARDLSHRILGSGSAVALSAEQQLELIQESLDGRAPRGVDDVLLEGVPASLSQQWRREIKDFQSAHGEEEWNWLPKINLEESTIEGE